MEAIGKIENFQEPEKEEDYGADRITEESLKRDKDSNRLKQARESLYQKGGEGDGRIVASTIDSANLTLEERLFMSKHSKEQLEKLGLRQCEGYASYHNYIPFRDASHRVYLFSKYNDKYILQFFADTDRH
ncbi:hypothetical protein JW756_00740 [Candidatus Woesearchaeota archaeon]|nr:hypothetical protein [Candidatus Woesearchaeota archaeon]